MTELEKKILEKCLKLQEKRPATYKTRSNIKPSRRKKIYERDGYKCLKCGISENLTIDHIVPISKGGVKRKFNLQTLCFQCNKRKKDNIICYKK